MTKCYTHTFQTPGKYIRLWESNSDRGFGILISALIASATAFGCSIPSTFEPTLVLLSTLVKFTSSIDEFDGFKDWD